MSFSSIPEPPPKPHGVVVPDALIKYLKENHSQEGTSLIGLVQERNAFGMAKYGQPLMSQDGRNGVEDARQEAGDLLQYIYKVHLTGDKEGVEKLVKLLQSILSVSKHLLDL